jgi:hypothetical protein
LWRDKDKVMIVGDAFVTTKQESVLASLTQLKILSGPPKYFTCDWLHAKQSVETLAALKSEIVATGNGQPMRGQQKCWLSDHRICCGHSEQLILHI